DLSERDDRALELLDLLNAAVAVARGVDVVFDPVRGVAPTFVRRTDELVVAEEQHQADGGGDRPLHRAGQALKSLPCFVELCHGVPCVFFRSALRFLSMSNSARRRSFVA